MIENTRILAILKAHHLSQTSLGKMFQLSHSKMSKVMAGEQTLPAEAVGKLIKEFGIHPHWLFGYEGNSDEVMYMKDLVPKSEVEKRDKVIQELKNELGEVYKQLAEERRSK
ncbi:helix-turn-helix domain-containing protein [Dyadobacter pollutisoli]|uniref:Helix-turn-helix transcriptional regulator n=1 Tax=Dyadobacter pollutisoli TaxID=2910158 RepID=A0A9E8SIJ8_9BACT|nr:helix-turn-helix transcriptional regulator [Dyadobacter pollutisoli]WAC09224.1 helix-turn-helix transcriptional regulator [Dyadobacter pollutisoli]